MNIVSTIMVVLVAIVALSATAILFILIREVTALIDEKCEQRKCEKLKVKGYSNDCADVNDSIGGVDRCNNMEHNIR